MTTFREERAGVAQRSSVTPHGVEGDQGIKSPGLQDSTLTLALWFSRDQRNPDLVHKPKVSRSLLFFKMKVLIVFACLLVAANAFVSPWGLYGLGAYNPALLYGAMWSPYMYGNMAMASMYAPYAYGAMGMAAATNAALASGAAWGGLGFYKKK